MEDKIKILLRKADQLTADVRPVHIDLALVRRRAERRRLIINIAAPAAIAALLFFAGIIVIQVARPHKASEQKQIVSLQQELKNIQAKTDAVLSLVQQVLEEERQTERLNDLQAALASIPDPIEETQRQVDKTAFILVYQADCLYRQSNKTDSAVQAYNRVIKLFPQTRWAEVARQRLTEIENKKLNKPDCKGDKIWKLQNA
jgi:tetratricopeptide (TPR) repeat protein